MTENTIKMAGIFDITSLVELCKSYWEEVKDTQPLAMKTFDSELCHANLGDVIMSKDFNILVCKRGDKCIGMLWLFVARPVYTQESYLAEQYFYVLPEYRNKNVAWSMLTVAKHYGRQVGCAFLQVGNLTQSESLDKAYSKRGSFLGNNYILPL